MMNKQKSFIHIKTPATTANMGPGFDSIGMAFQLYNHLYVDLTGDEENPVVIEAKRGLYTFPTDESNLIYASIIQFYKEMGITEKIPPIRLIQDDHIPTTRGLGSSAACIVSGLFAANEISGMRVSKQEIAQLAAKIEGHPDNSTPAVLGGVVVGAMTDKKLDFLKLYTGLFEQNNIQFAVMIPDFTLSTEIARRALPDSYSREDAVFNLSRAALLMAALATGDVNKLSVAMEDRVHEPYRLPLVPNMRDIFNKSKEKGALGAFLSGAGPTLIALFQERQFEEEMKQYLETLPVKWELRNLKPDYNGATVEIETELS